MKKEHANNISLDDLKNYRSYLKELETLKDMHNYIGKLLSPLFTKQLTSKDHAMIKLSETDKKIAEEAKKIEETISRVTEWIKECDDPEISAIVRYHFIDGYTWEKTTHMVYNYYGSDCAKTKIYRYFGRLKNNKNNT